MYLFHCHQVSGLFSFKLYGKLDVNPEVCVKVFMDLDYRRTWDGYVKGRIIHCKLNVLKQIGLFCFAAIRLQNKINEFIIIIMPILENTKAFTLDYLGSVFILV